MKIRWVLLPTAIALLPLLTGCDLLDGGVGPNLQAGHPLESTVVESWRAVDDDRIEVSLSFRDDAPSYGCSVEALSDDPSLSQEERSIGWLSAKPKGMSERTMIMKLDNGLSRDVDRVEVTDCDM